MKRILSLVLCFILIIACVQLPVSASAAATKPLTARSAYIINVSVDVTKSGSNIVLTGSLLCNASIVTFCNISLSLLCRDKGSSDDWTTLKTVFGNGTYSCSASYKTAYDSSKEYRGYIYCTAHYSGGIEHSNKYSGIC